MEYGLDLSCLSVGSYKELLRKQNLLPGRRILLQNIDRNFDIIENCGIENVLQLKKALSTSQKIVSFASKHALSEEYLMILKREIGSLEQKSVPLSDFPSMDTAFISYLNGIGIKTSKDYYNSSPTEKDELFCLCDLVRINGVGAIAARAFYESGYTSVSEIAGADAAEMLQKVSEINGIRQYYKANLGVKDMQFCIDFASLLMRFCN